MRIFSFSRTGARWDVYFDNVTLTHAPLDWTRPLLVNPITVSLGPRFTVSKLDPSRDYIIKLPPTKKLGGTMLIGGHNVVMVGGAITVPAGTAYESEKRGIYIKNTTGTVHIEGVSIDGSGGGYFDGIAISAPLATVQLQNLRIVGVKGGVNTFHGDIIQPWGGVKDLRIDHLSGSSNYQGLMLQRDLGPIGQAELSNVDITAAPTDEPRELAGKHMLWLTTGVATCNAYPTTLSEVYVAPRSTGNLGSSVWPESTSSLPCRASGTGFVTWPTLPITGGVTSGPPPEGNFVPPGVAGLDYLSPGYDGQP